MEESLFHLEAFGWNDYHSNHFEPYAQNGLKPARVVAEYTHLYRLVTAEGERLGAVTGKLRHDAVGREDFPAVGDWVAVADSGDAERVVIHAILPRRSKFSRMAVGSPPREQIVAANVDTIFLVSALNHDYNLRRVERYMTLAWESGASPVVLLNKADLCDDAEARVAEVEAVAVGVPVHVLSALENEGIEALTPYIKPGRTVALLGSSGVGKSTLLNRLVGDERMATQAAREGDDRGRHTTTHRELVKLPEGGLVLDTPGMRELGMWEAGDGLSQTFEDVAAIAEACRFNDCHHDAEPGCAIQQALVDGTLDPKRWENFQKLEREMAYQARKSDQQLMLAEKKRWKQIHQFQKQHYQQT